ncbi:universal stress protein [Roseovarius sp.]|uniref:universal stress protein n=1 Tax=Roseovarius sp. TaxID=1486281 RepID=UPI000C4A2BA7|nr:universal stress protein [Roseovarius sp.]MAZ19827.1 universal stress protein [Roseovarius sp.]|tara:strand:- start:1559 stop:2005 length:447 start_codon:yes stop_codon:yes gene_type:complete
MFDHILVALDGSDPSRNAAKIACRLNKIDNGRLTFMHIPHAESAAFVVGAVAGYHAAILKPTIPEIEKAGQKILDEATKEAEEAGCKNVQSQMTHGDAATEILKYAAEANVDLIVTGRRGLSGLASLVLGSTSLRINHHAKCACLSVV